MEARGDRVARHGRVRGGILALLEEPCYRMAKLEPPRSLAFDSPRSLEAWWEAGGHRWLSGYLVDRRPHGSLFVPPDARRTLTLESVPPDRRAALGFLLCGAADEACGAETAGWIQRAEDAFERHADRNSSSSFAENAPSERACAGAAALVAPADRYGLFRACVAPLVARRSAMPHGRLQAPQGGWLVVRGRRGHYAFCDELRAFDVATGATYGAKSCSGLEFGGNGMVDEAATDAKRRIATEVGCVPRDNVREAAWLMLLSPEIEHDVLVEGHRFDVPEGVPLRLAAPIVDEVAPRERWGSSAQTTLAWTYIAPSGEARAAGSFRWPHAGNAVDDHIARLLAVAEGGFVAGCASSALPKHLDLRGPGPAVSPLDASEEGVASADRALLQALEGLRGKPLCPRR